MLFYPRLFVTAMRSLNNHFLRSLLATMGVLIGVASVTASMSILEGASNKILSDFKSLGSNLLTVVPEAAQVQGRVVGIAQTLVPADGDVLLRELGDQVDEVAAVARGSATVRNFSKSKDYQVIATDDRYFRINAFETQEGRLFNRADVTDSMSRVVLLGATVASDLFGGMAPVGQSVKIRGNTYRVLGVMEERGNIGFMNADEAVYIPIKAALKRFFNRKFVDQLVVQGAEGVDLNELEKTIATILRREHNIRVGEKDDFRILNQQEALNNINSAALIFRVVFYSIAGISLVVGGIGIMNIMLVSVTERTREIGVRMAVGARRSDILLQFLAEALIISLLGGLFGLLVGWMMSDLIDKTLQGMFITEITTGVIVAALSVSTVVGVISGIYPAWIASRNNPVDALRYE